MLYFVLYRVIDSLQISLLLELFVSRTNLKCYFFLQICSLLHQRYKEFSQSLIQGLLKVFFPGKSGEDLEADKNLKAIKKRSTLKLLLEIFFVGVIEDSGIFINVIKDLTSIEHLKDRDATQTNMSLLASFARQGRIFLGLPLSGQEIHEEVLITCFILHPQGVGGTKSFCLNVY